MSRTSSARRFILRSGIRHTFTETFESSVEAEPVDDRTDLAAKVIAKLMFGAGRTHPRLEHRFAFETFTWQRIQRISASFFLAIYLRPGSCLDRSVA